MLNITFFLLLGGPPPTHTHRRGPGPRGPDGAVAGRVGEAVHPVGPRRHHRAHAGLPGRGDEKHHQGEEDPGKQEAGPGRVQEQGQEGQGHADAAGGESDKTWEGVEVCLIFF